jgi:RHS repeat-associated protein
VGSAAATQFTWDPVSSLLLSDGTSTFVYGPGGVPLEQIAGSTATYLQPDQLGSTVLLTSQAGANVGTYAYDPYGKATHAGSAITAVQFHGPYVDSETGFIYLRARSYDPGTDQFISRDPLEAETRTPYTYGADDPLDEEDPSGMSIWSDIGNAVTSAPSALGLAKSMADCLRSNSAYDCAVMNLDPAYIAVAGYGNEWDAASQGCPLSTIAEDGAEGVVGVGLTVLAAGGLTGAGGGRFPIPGDDTGSIGGSRLTPNQMNRAIYRGQAPRGIVRIDMPKVTGEQIHATFGDGSALNIDGTRKHGGLEMTNTQRDWLAANGWKLP